MTGPPLLTDDQRARVAAEAARQVQRTLDSHPEALARPTDALQGGAGVSRTRR